MDRRSFLKTTSVVATVATGVAAPALAAEHGGGDSGVRSDLPAPAIGSDVRHLVIVSAWPESVAGYSEQGRRLAERIQVASAGRFVFSFAHRDNRGGQVSATGDADLVLGSEHRNLGRHPAFAYFAGLPCRTGLRAADFDRWLAAGGGQMMWDGLAAEHGLKPLLIGHSGGRPGWWSAQPISRIADLQGKRVAVEGLARNVAAAIGAEPVEVLIGSMAPAVIEGDVAAAEWGGLLASCAIGLDKARCWTGFGINTNGTALSLGIRRDLWDAFSASDRAIFEGAAAEAFRFSLAEARVHEPILRKVLAETRGVQFGRLPEEDRELLRRVAEVIVADVATTDAQSRAINASYMAFRRLFSGTRRTSTEIV